MARHKGAVLVDTNVIIECLRTGSWKALTGGYAVETVEMCEAEAQTGKNPVDPQLLKTLKAVHAVTIAERAALLTKDDQARFLDAGELDLWAHALTRSDAWVLCGPDKASLRLGIRLGLQDRLVSLERLLDNVGFRGKTPLRRNYTQKWLDQALAEIRQQEDKS